MRIPSTIAVPDQRLYGAGTILSPEAAVDPIVAAAGARRPGNPPDRRAPPRVPRDPGDEAADVEEPDGEDAQAGGQVARAPEEGEFLAGGAVLSIREPPPGSEPPARASRRPRFFDANAAWKAYEERRLATRALPFAGTRLDVSS